MIDKQKEFEKKKIIFRAYQVVWYVVGLFEFLLLFRFIFRFSAASTTSPFVRMINSFTGPLIEPFRGIYPTTNLEKASFEWITLVAMLVWFLLAYGIVYLLQLIKPVDQREINKKSITHKLNL